MMVQTSTDKSAGPGLFQQHTSCLRQCTFGEQGVGRTKAITSQITLSEKQSRTSGHFDEFHVKRIQFSRFLMTFRKKKTIRLRSQNPQSFGGGGDNSCALLNW